MLADKVDCCGCGACMSACPANAIGMAEDACGFVYPRVDEARCVGCGKCNAVCPAIRHSSNASKKETFAAVAKDRRLLKEAASGGVFSVIARNVLEEDGIVCGAAFVPGNRVEHIMVRKMEELPRLQGSKYVQSNPAETFAATRDALRAGERVLYSGTPCQIAGLLGFLGGRHEKLLTVDVVCHGVPSARMFADYLHSMEVREGAKPESFRFRDKNAGWGLNGSVCRNGKRKILWRDESAYLGCFARGWIYRESCYHCRYAGGNHPGDLTLGDYWGIEAAHPECLGRNGWDERRGVSLVIANTEKGIAALRECSGALDLVPSSFERAAVANAQLREPSKFGRRSEILAAYQMGGWDAVEKLYFQWMGWSRYGSRLKAMAPRRLKRWIKSGRKYD